MIKKDERNSIIEICPIRNVVARFGNKWALLLILTLDEKGPLRFNQLGKQIPDISTKVLANTLHILESDGLISRTVFAEVPVRVEYALTATGKSLVPIIHELTRWALENMNSILKQRKVPETETAKDVRHVTRQGKPNSLPGPASR